MSDYRVVVYNVFVERGNVAVLQCNIPASVRDFVEILAWWRQEGRERTEIHSGGRYLLTTSGTASRQPCRALNILQTTNDCFGKN